MIAEKAWLPAGENRGRRSQARFMYTRLMQRVARYAGFRLFRLFERPIAPSNKPTAAGELDVRLLGERDVLRLASDDSLDLDAAKIRAAYARGDVCAGAFRGKELAGYCWFAFSAAPHMDRAWLDFPAHMVYTYKSFVRPAFRGRGIAAALYRCIDPIALERRRRLAIICVESHNAASVAAARRGGFSAAGYAAYMASARRWSWCSVRAARHGLRFFVPS